MTEQDFSKNNVERTPAYGAVKNELSNGVSEYTIHADGGARGNPGPSGAGAVIRDELGNMVGSVSEFLGHRTNNYAEYEAVIRGLETLRDLLRDPSEASVTIKMDSELVVKQMNGEYKVKHPSLKEQNARLVEAVRPFKNVGFTHVRREENGDADLLANEAMDRGDV